MTNFNLDNENIEILCSQCGFYNTVFFKQIKLNDVIICRGCKINLQLLDYLGESALVEKKMRRAIDNLLKSMDKINITFKI